MPIIREPRITRQMVREHPDRLFVFGDNLARVGYGGQAREMRDEPNAVGIPTKKLPTMTEGAFFSDADVAGFRRRQRRSSSASPYTFDLAAPSSGPRPASALGSRA